RLDLANLGQVGVMSEIQTGADIAELHDGDLVIAFTDGICERSRLSQRGAELALLGAIAKVLNDEPKVIASAIEECALREAGGILPDDATVIVLRVGRPPQ